jgi:pyruvate/2-oxoglutarate dehydrogenase complex dihydrolipoamide acyltransferase (E2) component
MLNDGTTATGYLKPASDPQGTGSSTGRSRFVSPVVGRLAAEHGIDPSTLQGSGREGRVTKKDILAAVASGRSTNAEDDAAPVAPGPDQSAAPAPAPRSPRWGKGKRVGSPQTDIMLNKGSSSRGTTPTGSLEPESDVEGAIRAHGRRRRRDLGDVGHALLAALERSARVGRLKGRRGAARSKSDDHHLTAP